MTMKSVLIDRRTFLGGAGFAAGAVVATALVPLSVVHAVSGDVTGVTAGGASGTWHVDDVCGHWPPYAHPIGYGHPKAVVVAARPSSEAAPITAHADAIDSAPPQAAKKYLFTDSIDHILQI